MRILWLPLLLGLLVTTKSGMVFAQSASLPDAHGGFDLQAIDANLQRCEIVDLLLAEEWTVCSTDESQPVLGRITGAESRDDGSVLILDDQQGMVFEFGPDGTFRRTLGRPGEGPGETSGAYNVCALPEGRTAIVEGAPPMVMRPASDQIIILDGQGLPERQFGIYDRNRDGVRPMLRGARFAGGLFVVGVHTSKMLSPDYIEVNSLMLVDETGNRLATLAERTHTESINATQSREVDVFNLYQYDRFDISKDGRIAYLPERDEYEVVVIDWPGRRGVRVRTELLGRERTEDDLEESLDRSGFAGTPVRWVASARDPVIRGLRFAPNGDLWVFRDARDDSPDERVFAVVDVYGRMNDLTHRFMLIVPGDRATDQVIPLRNGTYLLVRNAYGSHAAVGAADVSVSLLVCSDPPPVR